MRKILVVDDDPSLLEAMADVLLLEGYSVDTARNGRIAVDLLHQHPNDYSLVLLDVLMPVMDGPAVIRAMLRDNLHVPTVVVTGTSKRPLDSTLPWLGKPFDVEALTEIVKKNLRR